MAWSKTTAFRVNMMKLLFQNVTLPAIGDVTGLVGSTAPGSLYLSLHTGVLGENVLQNTAESAYAGYARVALPRNSTYFTVTASGDVELTSDVVFPKATGSATAVTAWGIGVAASGGTRMLYSKGLDASITIANGVVPVIKGGSGNSLLASDT